MTRLYRRGNRVTSSRTKSRTNRVSVHPSNQHCTILISATPFYSSRPCCTRSRGENKLIHLFFPLILSSGASILYADHHRHVFVRDTLKSNLVPPRRQEERRRMRIHGPRSLPRPRRRAPVSSLLALKVRATFGWRHISKHRR